MPMANVLVLGLLIDQLRSRSRRLPSGFVLFGAIALAVYVTMASLFADELLNPYLRLSYDLLFGDTAIQVQTPLQYPFVIGDLFRAVILALPQVAFALLGGFLFQRFNVSIVRH
jgi:hypothetical protein